MSQSSNIFNEISTKLSQETDLQKQLAIVVDGAMQLTRADAGTLYSLQDGKNIKFEVFINHTLSLNLKAPDIKFPDIPVHVDDKENDSMVVVKCVLKEESILVDDIYDQDAFNFSGTRTFDTQTGYKTHSVMTVPIHDFEKRIIGVIQLLNAQDEQNQIRQFNDSDKEKINLFVMQTAFTLSSKILIDKQKALFNTIRS